MIDLFIVKTYEKFADSEICRKSCIDLKVNRVYYVERTEHINAIKKESEWYLVLHDNEALTPELAEALLIFAKQEDYEVLVLFKLIDTFTIFVSPRMFRKHVVLPDIGTDVCASYQCVKVLNDFLL